MLIWGKIWGKPSLLTLVLVGTVAVWVATPAGAAKKTKSTQSEAEWMNFDPAAETVTVKITKPGKGPNKKTFKRNQEVVFNVIPEGSILKRTSCAINGVRGELKDIPAGKTVLVYWVPDPKTEGEYFARKVDVVLSEAELDARAEAD